MPQRIVAWARRETVQQADYPQFSDGYSKTQTGPVAAHNGVISGTVGH